jgi:RNA-directed DNA polymerase
MDPLSLYNILVTDNPLIAQVGYPEFYSCWSTACTNNSQHYRHFTIRKANGSKRYIQAPSDSLKTIQKDLIRVVRHRVPLYINGIYGLGGQSYSAIANASYHRGSHNVIIKMDIKDFFPSTTIYHYTNAITSRLGTFINHIEVLEALRPLLFCCINDQYRLPTGSPASPIVSAVCFSPVDTLLDTLARYNNLVYTRYIDDLTFSGFQYPDNFQKSVTRACESHGYRINHAKSEVLYKNNHKQIVTGVVINTSTVRVDREYRRQVRAELDHLARDGGEISPKLRGKINYIRQVDPDTYSKFQEYFLRRQNHWAQQGENETTTQP